MSEPIRSGMSHILDGPEPECQKIRNYMIRAIIASGYVDDPVMENHADYGFQGALTKPFKGKEKKSFVAKIIHG